MKIGIIGGGSVGLFFAAHLSESFQVSLMTRRQEQAKVIEEKGICLLESGERRERKLQAAQMNERGLPEADLFFVAVKQYHLPELVPVLSRLSPSKPLIFLQNGMGHLEHIEALPQENIFVCTVEHGILRENDCTVQVRGRGVTNIACVRGDRGLLDSMLDKCSPEFPFIFHSDPQAMLLEKLIANVIINPLTALLKVENGLIADSDDFRQAAFQLFNELVSVFPVLEHTKEATWKNVIEICRKTSRNRSSMLRDLEEGRSSELDAIVGYVLREAEKRQAKVPALTIIYRMVKGLESKGEE